MRREMMMRKRLSLVPVLFLVLLVIGCSGYARLRLQSGPDETMTIEKLKENWQSYQILYTGLEPNVPSAILFDRKDDDRKIVGERWWEMKDAKTLSDTIEWIRHQTPAGSYYPRLWKILGPDDYLYGYMFTTWDHAGMHQLDDKTLSVLDLPVPPSMTNDGPKKGPD